MFLHYTSCQLFCNIFSSVIAFGIRSSEKKSFSNLLVEEGHIKWTCSTWTGYKWKTTVCYQEAKKCAPLSQPSFQQKSKEEIRIACNTKVRFSVDTLLLEKTRVCSGSTVSTFANSNAVLGKTLKVHSSFSQALLGQPYVFCLCYSAYTLFLFYINASFDCVCKCSSLETNIISLCVCQAEMEQTWIALYY